MMNDTTSITVQITAPSSFSWEYQVCISLHPSGEHIRNYTSLVDSFRLTMTKTIDNLYPFTMYKIELRVRIIFKRFSSSEPWSYPATRIAKTLEEGIDVHLLKINVDNN